MRCASLLVVLLLAGCVNGDDDPRGPTDGSTTGAENPVGSHSSGHNYTLWVGVSDASPRTVGVPFPHGKWCLQASDWDLANATVRGANASLSARSVERGTVLWIESAGPTSVVIRTDIANRSECQTFRYNPWSIDPDPADRTVEVLLDQPTSVLVEVTEPQGSCHTQVTYEGMGRAGWSVLNQTDTIHRCI